ncbi:MAG: type transport system permease protein [Solirubrobacteraceae bacterium]|jgi:ABC-2 type transport system permease protein|nr:type transport system permease protein [Solirubrobacteraceae bacterium]
MTRTLLAREAGVVAALARRSLLIQFRRAQLLMPTFVLPLMLLAVIASGTSAARRLPGFPNVGSYISFVLPGTIIQGTLLAGLTTGIALASDIEFGFFDRLLAAPVHRVSLVLGRLFGTVGLAMMQSSLFLAVALIFGARYPGGVGAVLGTIGLAALTAAGIGGVAAAIALRTGSLSLLQSIFPFMFVLLFTAPAFFPRELLSPVLHDISVYNPLSYIVEGVRGLLLGNHALGDPWKAAVSAGALVICTTALATLALRERLRTT